jgi:hypothetical protein
MTPFADHFSGGLLALKEKKYDRAVEEFEHALEEQPGPARFYTALALLGGRNPGEKDPDDIERIERHLDQVHQHTDVTARYQADVLRAIVREDYYDRYDMPGGQLDPDTLRTSIQGLSGPDLEPLIEHIGPARLSRTWQLLQQIAVHWGLRGRIQQRQAITRYPDPDRPPEVRRYFLPTPPFRDTSKFTVAFAGSGLLLAIALVLANWVALLIVAAAFMLAKTGFDDLQDHRAYLRHYAAAEPKPRESLLADWLTEDVQEIVAEARGKVMLDTELRINGGDLVYPPQVVVGYDLAQSMVRLGDDSTWHADIYDVLVVFLTGALISIYRCDLDFRTGCTSYEQIDEYHYRDIVGVSEAEAQASSRLTARMFTLSISDGSKVSVAAGISASDGTATQTAWAGNKEALRIVKKMVRARHTV